MNLFHVLLILLLYSVSAKIIITSPKNNVTAKNAFDTLYSKVNENGIRDCGKLLGTGSQASYRSCIRGLCLPRIFEKHLWNLENDDFAAQDGIAFSGTMSNVIAKVSDEVEKACSHVDPNVFDQVTYDNIIDENCQGISNYKLDWLHWTLILIVIVLISGAVIYYLNDHRSVQINRKQVNNSSEKV